jgi:hypothetical protein
MPKIMWRLKKIMHGKCSRKVTFKKKDENRPQ